MSWGASFKPGTPPAWNLRGPLQRVEGGDLVRNRPVKPGKLLTGKPGKAADEEAREGRARAAALKYNPKCRRVGGICGEKTRVGLAPELV